MSGQELAQRSASQEIVAQVRGDAFKEQIQMALPENMPPSRFVRATVTALMQNPALAEVDVNSLFASLLKCAQDGLLPDGREAALVPYKRKAQYLPMIAGYRKIAGEHGWTIETVVVHARDKFSYELGLEPKVVHRPAAVNSDRGGLVAAYAVGRHRDGRRVVEVYEAADVERAKSVAQTDRVWKQWPSQMWEKTVGKRLFAKLPLDPGDRRVASVLDAETLAPGEAASMLYGPSGDTFVAREITQDSSGEGAGSQAEEEGPRSPTPPDGGPDAHPPGLAAPSRGENLDGDIEGQQAGGDDAAVSSSPAPGTEPQLPGADWKPAPPASAITKAGKAKVPHGDQQGRTLADILALGEPGVSWLQWAQGEDGWPDDFAANLAIYAQAKVTA